MSAPTSRAPARSTSWRVALALFLAIAACAAFLVLFPAGATKDVEIRLQPPYEHGLGATFVKKVDLPAWLLWNRARWPALTLIENGNTPHRTLRPTVRALKGAAVEILFRSSDDSDPNTNQSVYMVRYTRPVLPVAIHLAVAFVAATAAFLLLSIAVEALAPRRALRRLALVMLWLFYGAGLLESLCALLLADRLTGTPGIRGTYENAMGGEIHAMVQSRTANFVGHPYLNFVLNPDALYEHERQFDARYHVRRKEPIRPRREVAWRALVLGGSTAFGQLLPREEDTWVYRLEEKVRAAHGPAYDVVNGGVSGYNIIDNFIHYYLLLDELEPDVVVLYVGINDVHPRLTGELARDYSNSRVPWRAEANTVPLANPLLAPFASYRYYLLREIERRRTGHIFDYVQRRYDPVDRWPADLDRNGPEVFAGHLRNLVRLILAQGRKPIIVPQVFLPAENRRDQAFARGVREHNQAAEAIARELSVPFLANIAGAFDQRDVFDNCHLNAEGSEKMADLVFPALGATAGPQRTVGR